MSDRLTLTSLFRTNPGVRAGCIDQRHNRQAILLSQFHLQQRLAISLGVGASEVAGHAFFGVLALLVSNQQHLLRADSRKT